MVTTLLLSLAVYFLWWVIRLGENRGALSYAFAKLSGFNLPWVAILLGIYLLGCCLYLLLPTGTERLPGWVKPTIIVLMTPPALLLLYVAAKTWPMVNYKAPVTDYVLPAMIAPTARAEQKLAQWESGRDQLLDMFRDNIYGHTPAVTIAPRVTVIDTVRLSGIPGGSLTQSRLSFARNGETIDISLLSYLPENPRAIFVMANFRGNHSLSPDKDIHLSESWLPTNRVLGINNNRATQESRGFRQSRWPLELILKRGYGLVTFHYSDLLPDNRSPEYGLPFLLQPEQATLKSPWGAIGMWAWGYSRVREHVQARAETRDMPVIAAGHSRLGKTALWAAAQDTRFAAAISNNSGCLGAALSRRQYGETVDAIVGAFPYWFTPALEKFRNNEQALPIDQHQLLALIAPRPLYVSSGEADRWADPEGEYLATAAASAIYSLYGVENPWPATMPAANEPVGKHLKYHVRRGGHNVTSYDWQQWLQWADDLQLKAL